jgi:hypothetical protein
MNPGVPADVCLRPNLAWCKDVASVAYDPHSLGSHKRHMVVTVIR